MPAVHGGCQPGGIQSECAELLHPVKGAINAIVTQADRRQRNCYEASCSSSRKTRRKVSSSIGLEAFERYSLNASLIMV